MNIVSLDDKVTSMDNLVLNVKNLNFDNVWKGAAATTYNESINSVIAKMNKEKENIQTFNTALEKVEELKDIDKLIDSNNVSLSKLDSNDQNNISKIQQLESENSRLTTQRNELKKNIVSMLGSITSDNSSVISLSYNSTADFDYICDIKELESLVWKSYRYGVSNGALKSGNIADLYSDVQYNGLSGMDYINSQLDSVLKSCSGREAAVNSSLMLMKLAADKGVKIRYMNAGSNGANGVKYNTNEQMVDGMDCCAYVSWAVNKGTPQPFHWAGVGSFGFIGDPIDVSQSLPGDVVVNDKHVAMIVANDTVNKQVTIIESGGISSDYHMVTYGYNGLRGSFPSGTYPKVMSLEDYYTGAKNNVNGTNDIKFNTWKEKEDYY